MFYFKELYYRFCFTMLSFSLLFCMSYNYKDILVYVLTTPFFLLKINNVNYFIYTHPSELTKVIIYLVLFTTFFFLLPYACWSTLDFLKPGLTIKESIKLSLSLFYTGLFFCIINLICFLVIFPLIWFFFESFSPNSSKYLNFFLELKIEDYLNFIIQYLYTLNILFFLILIFYIFFLYTGLAQLIYFKKILILSNIIIATIISPPEVFYQLSIFIILLTLLENFYILIIFYLKMRLIR